MVHQHEFQRVERQVHHQISRAQSHYFDVVFHSYSAQQTISIFLHPRSQGEGEFPLPVNWNASKSLPGFPDDLNADVVLFGRRTVLEN